jgi:hypothetical protein
MVCHRRPRALALEGEIAQCLDMDLAVAGDDSDRTRDVAGVEVTREHVSHAGQPFRREATAGHSLLLLIILSIFVRYNGSGLRWIGLLLAKPSSFVGGHPDLPAGGHEEDNMAITERDRIR